MDDRFFAQLNQLERGAREPHPRRQTILPYSDDNDYDDTDLFEDNGVYGDENFPPNYTTQTDHHYHEPYVQSQMLPPQGDYHPQRPQMPHAHGPSAGRRFDLSQYSYNDAAAGGASSSSARETLPSSPVVNANRRRSAASTQVPGRQSMQHVNRDNSRLARTPVTTDSDFGTEDDEYVRPMATQVTQPMVPPTRNRQTFQAQTRDGPPVVQGIQLVSTHDLPDRFRSIFPSPLFNAVQSKSLPVVYNTNDNFVLSAPTGSGKTAVLELAICRLMNGFTNGSFKIIYQAPTKSLCSERQRDWQKKFKPLDLEVAELTGDTDNAQLHNVQHASIIVTTPEKWDSITRKWKDHQKLMQMVKLFLIDEVHILKEDRGATLEAIVSRMKFYGSDIRFVALSATVPNSQDIATWLGKDSMTPNVPAPRERFGEEFRPVPLAKHVCGYNASANDFAFEKMLNTKLPDVIAKWSQRKPIMVFCFTRNSTVDTAKLLASWWAGKSSKDRYWEAPKNRVIVEDKELKETVPSGVAYHHAGLSINDRSTIEKAYLNGDINVICCTSTLAVGINLPCHMVIIKHTVSYQNHGGPNVCKEYSDLEVMQMLGRAGRPQFDNSAVAVILTRMQKKDHYEKMVTGQELLESCLHRNLIDHFNAEIGLGTITSSSTAKKWLCGTFLYVRLKDNPEHYKIDGDVSGRNLDERLDIICNRAVALLQKFELVQSRSTLQCTEFGHAMARYYLQFETMKNLLALPRGSKTSEILSCIAQAAEFSDIRFRAGEKPTYKALNQNSSIKFPIPVNLDAPAHKVSLVIQAVLGAIDLPSEDGKQRMDFASAKSLIFQSAQRLIRCVIDCNVHLKDAVTSRNALALARSLSAQVWDDSPLHMKQLEGVGIATVRKLVGAGLKTIDGIANAEHHRLEGAMSRRPPFGKELQDKAKAFPKLRFEMKAVGEPIIRKQYGMTTATVKIRANIGFINEKTPETFQKQPVNVCFLAERSDGYLIYFGRTSAKKLSQEQNFPFEAQLTGDGQTVRGYVMCDALAGTLETAFLRPDVPPGALPRPKPTEQTGALTSKASVASAPAKRKASNAGKSKRKASDTSFDEFGDGNINDSDIHAIHDGFQSIDKFEAGTSTMTNNAKRRKQTKVTATPTIEADLEPRRLENGNWACSHNCKDKENCRHICCREGLVKKPKPKANDPPADTSIGAKQTKLNVPVSKKTKASATTSSTQPQRSELAAGRKATQASELHSLNALHDSVSSNTQALRTLHNRSSGSGSRAALPGSGRFLTSFAQAARQAEQEPSSDEFGGLRTSMADEMDLTDSARDGRFYGMESALFETDNNLNPSPASANEGSQPVRPKMVPLLDDIRRSFSSDFGGFNMAFIAESSDSAAFDLGVVGQTKSPATGALFDRDPMTPSNGVSTTEKAPATASDVRMAEVSDEPPQNSDSNCEGLKEMLGGEYFNFLD